MNATWLTKEEAQSYAAKSRATAQAIVQGAFPEWPESRCNALLAACQAHWAKGPITTAGTLSQAAGLILAAWRMRDHIAGVLLLREGEGFVPLYLHRLTLALRMQSPTALWVDFSKLKEAE